MKEQKALQIVLKSRLESLRLRYPAYSMRAFAKRAGVSPATMSLLIQGKRTVSLKLATSLSERLEFDPQERSEVLPPPQKAATSSAKSSESEKYLQITLDQYRLISDWRAFAILNLIKTVDFRSELGWIADRLGLKQPDVEDVIESLQRLQMLDVRDGKYVRTVSKYRTTEDVANSSLQRSHAQTLDLAHASLEKDSVEMRDFTWLTLPMDLSKMTAAKAMIRKFQDDLASLLESDAAPTQVYRLAVQLFPLTKIKTKSKKGRLK